MPTPIPFSVVSPVFSVVRWVALTSLVSLTVVFVACDPGIELTAVNNTEVPVCVYDSGNYEDGEKRPVTTGREGRCSPLEPHTSTTWATLCYEDSTKWVVVGLAANHRGLYAR